MAWRVLLLPPHHPVASPPLGLYQYLLLANFLLGVCGGGGDEGEGGGRGRLWRGYRVGIEEGVVSVVRWKGRLRGKEKDNEDGLSKGSSGRRNRKERMG